MLQLAKKIDALRQIFATYYKSPSPGRISSCATNVMHQNHLKEVKAAIHLIAEDDAFCEEVGVDLEAGQVAYYLARDRLGGAGGMSWSMLGAQEKREWEVAVTRLDEASELCGLKNASDGDGSPKDKHDRRIDAEIEHELGDECVRELGSHGINIPELATGADYLELHANVGASTLNINILDPSSSSPAKVLVPSITSSQATNMSHMGISGLVDQTTNSTSLSFKLKVAELVDEWKVRRYDHRETSLDTDVKTQLSGLKSRKAADPLPAQGWSSILIGGYPQSKDKMNFWIARVQPAVPRSFESSRPASNSKSAEQLAKKWTSFFQPPSPPTSGYTMSSLGSNRANTNIEAQVNTRKRCPPCILANLSCYGGRPCIPCLERGKDTMYCQSHITMSGLRNTMEMIKDQEAEELGDKNEVTEESDKNNSCNSDDGWACAEAPPTEEVEVAKS